MPCCEMLFHALFIAVLNNIYPRSRTSMDGPSQADYKLLVGAPYVGSRVETNLAADEMLKNATFD